MKKLFVLLSLAVNTAFAQNTFRPEWIILDNHPTVETIRTTNAAKFGSNETVLAFDRTDKGTLALDPIGRTINIVGNYVSASYSKNGFSGPCLSLRNILLKDGTTIKAHSFLWCFEIDSVSETAKLQLANTSFVTVPLKKIELIRTMLNKNESNSTSDSGTIYKTVAQMPQFNGNVAEWLSQNLRYPDNARKSNRTGRVILKFIINENGYVQDPEIKQSTGDEDLDNEALRVIKAMPAWIPGINEGKAVKVYFMLPITFKLTN